MFENLKLKLEGKIPIDRVELFTLIDSWGRKDSFETNDYIQVYKSYPKKCYPLENLDISQIIDMNELFRESLYNGDLSKWDVSNVINFDRMFAYSDFNGNISNWDISKAIEMSYMFYLSKFNGDTNENNLRTAS